MRQTDRQTERKEKSANRLNIFMGQLITQMNMNSTFGGRREKKKKETPKNKSNNLSKVYNRKSRPRSRP